MTLRGNHASPSDRRQRAAPWGPAEFLTDEETIEAPLEVAAEDRAPQSAGQAVCTARRSHRALEARGMIELKPRDPAECLDSEEAITADLKAARGGSDPELVVAALEDVERAQRQCSQPCIGLVGIGGSPRGRSALICDFAQLSRGFRTGAQQPDARSFMRAQIEQAGLFQKSLHRLPRFGSGVPCNGSYIP